MRLFIPLFMATFLFIACSDGLLDCSEQHPNGTLATEVACNSEGLFHGQMNMYYESGKLQAIRHFEEGYEQDTARYYYEANGKLQKMEPMVNNLSHGRVQWYRSDGTLEKEAGFVQGQKHGEELLYYEDGKQIKEKNTYQYDQLYGPHGVYRRNGIPIREGVYYNGFRFEQWKQYTPEGDVASAFSYRYNKKHGPFAIYRPSAIPYVTGEFREDLVTGKVNYYNNEGSIVHQEEWIGGENINYSTSSKMPRSFGEGEAGFKVGKLQILVKGDEVIIK